jgi:hypothetical protein
MNLKIIINNLELDLPEDFRFTLVQKTQLFDTDKTPQAIAVDINVYSTPVNDVAFSYFRMLNSSFNRKDKLPAKIVAGGCVLINGYAHAKKYKDGNYSVFIKDMTRELSEENVKRKMSDFAFTQRYKRDKYTFDNYHLGHQYAMFPVKNPDYFKEVTSAQIYNSRTFNTQAVNLNENFNNNCSGTINYFDSSAKMWKYEGRFINAGQLGSGFAPYVISFFPYVTFILRNIFEYDGILMNWGMIGERPWREMVMYTNTHLYSNKSIFPNWDINDFIKSIQNFVNIIFVINNNKKCCVFDKREIVTTQADKNWTQLLVSDIDIETNIEESFELIFKRDNSDRSSSYVAMNFVSDNSEHLKDPVNTLNDFKSLNPKSKEIRFVMDEYRYYQFLVTQQGKDLVEEYKALSLGQDIKCPDKPKQIKTSISATAEEGSIPYTQQDGNSLYYDNADIGMRIMFNHGLRSGSPSGGTYLDGHSLYPDGEDGLFEKRHKDWILFLESSTTIRGLFQLPLSELNIENFYKKKKINDTEFIIEEVATEIFPDRIGLSDIKARAVL